MAFDFAEHANFNAEPKAAPPVNSEPAPKSSTKKKSKPLFTAGAKKRDVSASKNADDASAPECSTTSKKATKPAASAFTFSDFSSSSTPVRFSFCSTSAAPSTKTSLPGFVFSACADTKNESNPKNFWDDDDGELILNISIFHFFFVIITSNTYTIIGLNVHTTEGSDSPEFLEVRRLRSITPDAIVVVGEKEYECFKVSLCCASDYLDALLESTTKVDNMSRIVLEDKDPKEWEIFYKTIDPLIRIGEVRPENPIDENNAVMLTRWFHEFKMESHLKECDSILKKKFIDATHWIDYKRLHLNKSFWISEGRNESFHELIDLLKHSCTYDLRQTSSVANKTFGFLLEHEPQLFNTTTVKILVELCVPIDLDADGNFLSKGKCSYIWKNYLSTLVNEHKDDLSVDMINSNEMFPLLLHAYMQQSMKEKEKQAHQFSFGS